MELTLLKNEVNVYHIILYVEWMRTPENTVKYGKYRAENPRIWTSLKQELLLL